MNAANDIGFGRKIRISWLERACLLSSSGVRFLEARSELVDLIKQDNPGDASIKKILSSVKRVWFSPPSFSLSLHEDALSLAQNARYAGDRLALQYGKAILSYPFIGETAETCGRLIRIQGGFRTPEIVRRIQERFGDRGFTTRCARYNVSSFLDWGLLNIEDHNRYLRNLPIKVQDEKVLSWILTVVIKSLIRRDAGLSEVANHPALFPFSIPEITPDLMAISSRLVIKRIGHNQEVVSLDTSD